MENDKVVIQPPYSSLTSSADVNNVDEDLPPAVREAIVVLRSHAVVAWTKLDPALESRVLGHVLGNTLWPCLVVPCLWPFLIAAPLTVAWAKIDGQNSLKNQYWILTTAELQIVTMDYERPG
jgi:hypothetical protein